MCIQSVITSLETSGEPSVQPFPTSTQAGTTGTFSLTESHSLPTGDSEHKGVALKAAMTVPDIFQPIATTNPPSEVTSRGDHPVPKLGIVSRLSRLLHHLFTIYGIGFSKLPDLDE